MRQVERKLTPPKLKRSSSYKPYVRVDFNWSCAYCTRHEAENGGHYNFEVDHFRPASLFPHLALTYLNLYYSCRKCNRVKSDTWPSLQQQQRGLRFVDPCVDDPTDHFEIWYSTSASGLQIDVRSKPGWYTVGHLMLKSRTDIVELHKLRYIQKERLIEIKYCMRSLIRTLRSDVVSEKDRELLLATGAILRKDLLHLRKAVSGKLASPY